MKSRILFPFEKSTEVWQEYSAVERMYIKLSDLSGDLESASVEALDALEDLSETGWHRDTASIQKNTALYNMFRKSIVDIEQSAGELYRELERAEAQISRYVQSVVSSIEVFLERFDEAVDHNISVRITEPTESDIRRLQQDVVNNSEPSLATTILSNLLGAGAGPSREITAEEIEGFLRSVLGPGAVSTPKRNARPRKQYDA